MTARNEAFRDWVLATDLTQVLLPHQSGLGKQLLVSGLQLRGLSMDEF
jgi:hypothetical protein